jgi:uncharacterized protein (DUF1015 family)
MDIHAFCAWRPLPEVAHAIASVPYDTVDRAEAKALAAGNPQSFLHVVRPEINLPDSVDSHDPAVYAEATAAMERLLADGDLMVDHHASVYLYRLQMGSHVQRGVVACCNADDYRNGLILRHEKTRQDKEDDRTRHVRAVAANTGPVFLTYSDDARIDALVDVVETTQPLYALTAPDGVIHTIWKVDDASAFREAFGAVPRFYIADGHHRAAAAVRAAEELQREQPGPVADEASRFLAVLFPAGQLKVLGYHRVVADLHGLDPETFLAHMKGHFSVEAVPAAFEPVDRGQAGMYLGGTWYRLQWEVPVGGDPVAALDVSVLQDQVLGPILGIDDPRTSSRIAFIGGIRGTAALEKEVDEGRAAVAFAMCPVAVEEVMTIAEAGREMPPKSTWFEPKLRSGLLVHPFAG